MSKTQDNVLEALKGLIRKDRPWLPLSVLNSFDGRAVNALMSSGKIEVNLDYGVRVK